jgi:hypothetical protein
VGHAAKRTDTVGVANQRQQGDQGARQSQIFRSPPATPVFTVQQKRQAHEQKSQSGVRCHPVIA